MSTTPGPWEVAMLSREQVRPYYVVRQIDIGTSCPGWEQLQVEEGGIASFATADEARAALAKAQGEA